MKLIFIFAISFLFIGCNKSHNVENGNEAKEEINLILENGDFKVYRLSIKFSGITVRNCYIAEKVDSVSMACGG